MSDKILIVEEIATSFDEFMVRHGFAREYTYKTVYKYQREFVFGLVFDHAWRSHTRQWRRLDQGR